VLEAQEHFEQELPFYHGDDDDEIDETPQDEQQDQAEPQPTPSQTANSAPNQHQAQESEVKDETPKAEENKAEALVHLWQSGVRFRGALHLRRQVCGREGGRETSASSFRWCS
jgi:hypothetical protein